MSVKVDLEKEREVIESCKRDLDNFKIIYLWYRDDLYRYVYALAMNKDLTEDIVSSAILKSLESIGKFKWQGVSVKYWMLKIARNEFYSVVKKSVKGVDIDKVQLTDNDENIEDYIVREDLKDRLKELIYQLDPQTREVIILKIWEELAFEQVSEIVGMKLSAVKMRYYRGLKYLKNEVENG